MSDATFTLARLLPPDVAVDAAQMRLDGNGSAAARGTELGFLQSKIDDGVRAALDVDVMEILAEAWAKTDDLRQAGGSEAASATPTHLFLAKHDVVCDNQLKVALEFAGMPAITDHLDLRLTASFEGVGVTIEHGCIVAVDAGRGAAKAELLYSNARVLGRSTDWVALPAHCTLARPVRIG